MLFDKLSEYQLFNNVLQHTVRK